MHATQRLTGEIESRARGHDGSCWFCVDAEYVAMRSASEVSQLAQKVAPSIDVSSCRSRLFTLFHELHPAQHSIMSSYNRRAAICSSCITKITSRAKGRAFSRHSARRDDALTTSSTGTSPIDDSVILGSAVAGRPSNNVRTRRLRAVQQQLGDSGPKWEEMPYQCFQEARKFLLEDRQEKLKQIQTQREKMARIQAQEVAPQDESYRQKRLTSMRKRLEELKIHADINDPLVKKRFEDGNGEYDIEIIELQLTCVGDMSKPIFRYLADRKWRDYERKIVEERITQMNVIPDVLPEIDLVVQTQLGFKDRTVRPHRRMQHGQILQARETEHAPNITIQPFDRGARLVTIAVVNHDVPDVASDGFRTRCHFLAVNIPISPTETQVDLAALSQDQIVHSWLPAWAQKGLPYQRMAVFVLEQPLKEDAEAEPHATRSRNLDAAELQTNVKYGTRDGFSLRALTTRYRLTPVGADLYRTVWDETTPGVMERAGLVGAEVEFKRKKIEPLPYKRMASRRYR